ILYDQWVELKCVIDLDNNIVDEYYNGELFSTHQWDDNVHGTIGAIDLYSEGASSIYYDDITIAAPTVPLGAYNPNPSDGAVLRGTWASIGWSAGAFAESHDVYFGETFDDVNDGTGDTFRGNYDLPYFVVGITGYPYPDGLENGKTYYWRIDEVNDLHPDSPLKSDVWSFRIAPKTAFEPVPSDGSKFIDTENLILNWTVGMDAKLHTVYFGDDYDTVANATDGESQGVINFSPGPLEIEKTYYWRVDEFDAANTYTGDVWSFTTAKAGGGLKAEYFNNNTLSGEPGLTRLDPEIDFNWGNADVAGQNSPDESINVNNFSARWSGELEVDLTDAYTFVINANNGFRLWLDGQLIIDFWDNPTTSSRKSEPIELVGGATYSIQMDYFEGEDTAIAQLFWESSTRDNQIVPQAALAPPVKARNPKPLNGTIGVRLTDVLTWKSGDDAASHEVYFGTDANAVTNATNASPEYKGSKALGDESYDPGKLAWDTTYYWRVDEVNSIDPNSPWVGNVWSFATGDFFVVDNFESYDVGNNEIWWAWKDGLGYALHDNEPAYLGNGTGSAVGDETTASYTEETIVHGGRQSMPLSYDNNKQGYSNYSEVELTLSHPRDWTENDVNTLTLWIIGDPGNAAEPLYVAVSNAAGAPAVVVNDDPAAAQINTWTEWIIPLQAFADQGIVLTNVDRIAIGLGTRGNITIPGGSGKMFFDDIRLYRPELTVEVLFEEDFESYAAGSDLHGQGGWKGWGNDVAWGAPASDAFAVSGLNSVEVIGTADLVHEFDLAGGMLEFSAMQYIPSGTTGTSYFILLNTYSDDGSNNDWSVQTIFDLAAGTIAFWGGETTTILYDQWVELKLVIDLDNNTVDEYYNGELISTHEWDDNVNGTLGAIDLYSEGASSIYYDDITVLRP
ncbi:MAG TPA: PA14 domain-containing protein, partial [Sedimentisphaerales bacterium]|nr:PA14 domain-containing protein [Sedimentisphaerales bacterium]